jgi:hypothetical protein
MDNRIFNVNGTGLDALTKVLDLAFLQSGFNAAKCWRFIPEKGFVLFWTDSNGAQKLPAPMGAAELAPMIHRWLESEDSTSMKCEGWDKRYDGGDVDTDLGWRVYVEDWGHIAGEWAAICAVRPAYMWYGK